MHLPRVLCLLAVALLALRTPCPAGEGKEAPAWVGRMKEVHARFKGERGTLAHFGDSITVTMAYWAPLAGQPKGMPAEMAAAHELVRKHMKPECWAKWKGPGFGSNGWVTDRLGLGPNGTFNMQPSHLLLRPGHFLTSLQVLGNSGYVATLRGSENDLLFADTFD